MDKVLQAIFDPVLRQILDLLVAGELPAGEIAAHFPAISRPAVSQHLAVLRAANLVDVRRTGRHHLYSLNPSPLRLFWEGWLSKYESLWATKLRDLKRLVESAQDPPDHEM